MLRFILDFHATNIIVIFDSSPPSVDYVDFYYVADFLKIKKNEEDSFPSIETIFNELLLYWKSLFTNNFDEVYLIYDLSDQYISAFHFEKYNFKGKMYFKVSKKYTQEISGYSINKDTTLQELKSKTWSIDEHFSHFFNLEFAVKGIDWSIENLKINTNPINT
jgi:hypothetical protein